MFVLTAIAKRSKFHGVFGLIFLSIISVALVGCNPITKYEKALSRQMKQHPSCVACSVPMTEESHYYVYEEDGGLYYCDLKDGSVKTIMDPTVVPQYNMYSLGCDENLDLQIVLQKFGEISYPFGEMLAEARKNGERCSFEYYCKYPHDYVILQCGGVTFMIKYNEPNTLYEIKGEFRGSEEYNDEIIFRNDLFEDAWIKHSSLNAILDGLNFNLGYYEGLQNYVSKPEKEMDCYSIVTLFADIDGSGNFTLHDTFLNFHEKFPLAAFKDPDGSGFKEHVIKALLNNLVSDWKSRSSTYSAFDKLFTNEIDAAQKVQKGEKYLMNTKFESIGYSDKPQYKYRVVGADHFIVGSDMVLVKMCYLYTNDENFAQLKYPCHIWFSSRFKDRDFHHTTFTDGVAFYYSDKMESENATPILPGLEALVEAFRQ